ncbi:MAG TPA: LysE/ArgO family amino acid transporter [Arenibaculum sp.]|nr:LysE/ArgO family amino acid transporter [Arenibaculum sp.]
MERFIPAAIEGFSLGAGLIIAIGAQNAFVLRQGLARRHLLPVVLFCSISDATLIAIGAAGFGSLVASQPALLKAIGLGGAAFLGWYGFIAFRNALHARSLRPEERVPANLHRALATVAALTLLNPHVYLDTVVLLGGIAGRYAADARAWFAGGAMAASAVWFFSLGYGARLLAPVFARPGAWRVLDVLIGIVMTTLALALLVEVMG